MLVMKFGGSILNGSSDFIEICDYIAEIGEKGDKIIVISAMKGVTDSLLKLSSLAASGDEIGSSRLLMDLEERHLRVCEELGLACEDVRREFEKLERVIRGITYLGELTPRVRDLVASFGENFSGRILSSLLRSRGINSRFMTGGEAGIITDDLYGNANPLLRATRVYLRTRLLPVLEDTLPVIAGFSGMTRDGKVTTMGRGGSDLTAVLVGSALNAEEVLLWTDVDGFMTADPRIVRDARLLRRVSYMEAIEMAHFGAKRMNPRFIEPAMLTNTPIRVRNFRNRACEGTLISKEGGTGNVVRAVGMRKGVSILTVRSAGMVGRPGSAYTLLKELSERSMNVQMISQSISESDISLVLDGRAAEKARGVIEAKLLGNTFREVTLDRGCAAVAVIGSGMRGTPGVAARVFRAVAERGINVKMIAQGSSELSISFVVSGEDGEEAVRSLHEEFELSRVEG
ncbi:MAG: aspartate kinase, monofunctional class [Candidatus Korarchaeota archaeon NZ13-K]|nr:MAG: aspartate kinase, monofunctional class [Candidatus Korarchaeota archaeon NZ13-K]